MSNKDDKFSMKKEDREWAQRQTKSRHRPRSTVFENELTKSQTRQHRRHNEQQIILDELVYEQEENEAIDELDLESYTNKYNEYYVDFNFNEHYN